MKYKAIFLDLDGTIIQSDYMDLTALPSARTVTAIRSLKKKLLVCVATGRPLYAAKNIFDHLALTGLCVLNNGVQIYDPLKKQILYETALDQKLIPQILRTCQKYGVEINLFDGFIDHVYKVGTLPKKILSIYVAHTTEKIVNAIMQDLRSNSKVALHKMHEGEDFFLEITDAHVSKLHGISTVAQKLNLHTEEIIGVGDSYNDFPLLMASGLKFVMGNGVAELKAIADFIAPRVDQDGVAVIIEKFILPLFEK